MTIKDLFNLAVVNGWEDAEILIDYKCDDYWYAFENVPLEEEILYYDKDFDKIHITL
jgi:hypothetical protein